MLASTSPPALEKFLRKASGVPDRIRMLLNQVLIPILAVIRLSKGGVGIKQDRLEQALFCPSPVAEPMALLARGGIGENVGSL